MNGAHAIFRCAAGVIFLAGLAAPAALASPPANAPLDDPAEHLQGDPIEPRTTLTPGVWLPRLDGDATFGPGGTPSVSVEDTLDLNDLEVIFNGELSMRYDRIDLAVSGFNFSTGSTTTLTSGIVFGDVTADPGDRVKSSVEITSYAASIGYAYFPAPDLGSNLTFRFGPTLGVRSIDVEQSVTEIGGVRQRGDVDGVAIVAGALLSIEYRDRLAINASIGIGSTLDGDSTLTRFGADITWRPTDHLGITFGYRLFGFDVEDDDYEFDGDLQGLFVAASLEF